MLLQTTKKKKCFPNSAFFKFLFKHVIRKAYREQWRSIAPHHLYKDDQEVISRKTAVNLELRRIWLDGVDYNFVIYKFIY